jgi:hypothetical protein
VALPIGRLPRYLVLEPTSTVRFEVRPGRSSYTLEVELDSPRPGRSFLLLVGPHGGPVVQRMRLSGRAKILFRRHDPRAHVLMLANPHKEPLVLRLSSRLGPRARGGPTGGRRRAPARAPRSSPVARLAGRPMA